MRCHASVQALARAAGIGRAAEVRSAGDLARLLTPSTGLAYHYTEANGHAASILVSGSCNGGAITQLAPEWDEVISSTRHQACGRIKHFAGPNGSGEHQITRGSPGSVSNMNAALNNRVSSIYYYES